MYSKPIRGSHPMYCKSFVRITFDVLQAFPGDHIWCIASLSGGSHLVYCKSFVRITSDVSQPFRKDHIGCIASLFEISHRMYCKPFVAITSNVLQAFPMDHIWCIASLPEGLVYCKPSRGITSSLLQAFPIDDLWCIVSFSEGSRLMYCKPFRGRTHCLIMLYADADSLSSWRIAPLIMFTSGNTIIHPFHSTFEITYPFLNLHSVVDGVFGKWVSNFISHLIGQLISYPSCT